MVPSAVSGFSCSCMVAVSPNSTLVRSVSLARPKSSTFTRRLCRRWCLPPCPASPVLAWLRFHRTRRWCARLAWRGRNQAPSLGDCADDGAFRRVRLLLFLHGCGFTELAVGALG